MKIPFMAWLFQGLPEAIGIAAVMYAVAGLGLRWRSIVPVGLIFGVFFYLVRLLPIAFGVNTLLNVLFTVLVFQKITSCHLALAVRSGLVAFATVVIGENLFIQFFVWVLRFNVADIYNNVYLRIVFGWPNVILLFLVAIVTNAILNKKHNKGVGR